jgi:hypothetical protein
MQGIYVGGQRAKTKKALKEACKTDAHTVELEATSVFGNEYEGVLAEAPDGTYTVVGPDPYTARNWYANITKTGERLVVA